MITVELAARNFLRSCRASGCSPNTVKWYMAMLRPLVGIHYHTEISKVTATDLRFVLLKLKEKDRRHHDAPNRSELTGGISVESYRDYVRVYKRFFSWCAQEYGLDTNPMKGIKMPPASKRAPAAISMDDFKRLVNACDNSPIGVRDNAILTFLLDTGCRAGGLLTLTSNALDLQETTALVIEKGGRQRTVAFSEMAKFYLERWLKIRPLSAGDRVFCSLSRGHEGNPLTISALHQMLNRLKKKRRTSRAG